VVNGLPGRLVKDRLTAVGNSLVPQVALVFMKAIAASITSNASREVRGVTPRNLDGVVGDSD
jgi:hypothetical protein